MDYLLAYCEQAKAKAKAKFSQSLLLQGFALIEFFPLPPSLDLLLADFQKTGAMPTAAQLRAAFKHG